MHILIVWSRNKELLHPVKDILEQYEMIKGQKYFSNILLISKEFMVEHRTKIRELFSAITENQSKKIASMKSKLDMDKVFALEDEDHKTDILFLFLQFSNLNSPQNKKYLSKCKGMSSEVIQLLISAHEKQENYFVDVFQSYLTKLKNQKDSKRQKEFDENCVEFAKMACESLEEEIVLFLIKHNDVTQETKVKMLPSICSYGLDQTLKLCMFKLKHQFVDQLEYFEYFLSDHYHDPKYKENINKCIDLMDPLESYVDENTRIDSMPSLKSYKNLNQHKFTKDHKKEVKYLVNKAHNLEINYAIPKLLDYYFYINNNDTLIIDELSPKDLEYFLNSRIKNKDDHANYISVNLNFLFNYQVGEETAFLKESMNLLEYVSNLESYQNLISHPVLKLYINLMHHRFHFFNVTHCLWIALMILTLLDGITNKNVWMFFWMPFYILVRDAFIFLHIKGDLNIYGLLSVGFGTLGLIGMFFDEKLFIVSSAILILLATRELFLLLVHLNSNLYLHISMFMKVAAHLRDIIFMYLFILLAFAISFHVIYQDEIEQSLEIADSNITLSLNNISLNLEETQDVYEPKDYEWMFSHFHTPGSAFLKILVMLTGEFDAANTEMTHWYHFLFFIGFLFFAVTLFNLINALAIEDVHVSLKHCYIF